ncbi:MAG: RT0821/Lpp0805 family surface protein [Alphaproteobacteria bacterium]
MSINRISKVALACAIVLSLGACQTAGGQKQAGGTLLGAGLGALAGSQIGSGRGQLVSVALGTLGGAFLGNSVGKSLDRADRAYAGQAVQSAQSAPIGQPVVWHNPDTGNQGSVVAVREGTHTATGAYCREYQQTVSVGGRMEEAYGTACRQPDGSWKIL